MSDRGEVEIEEDEGGELQLPPHLKGKVPKKAQPIALALSALPHKDRASIFRAFNKQPPSEQTSIEISRTIAEMTISHGPLPPAQELERYNAVIPNGAERLMSLVEKQQEHRHNLENKVVMEQLKQSGRGQIFALVIGVGALGTSAYLGYLGQAVAAGTVATVALGTLAVAFIVGRKESKSDSNSSPKNEE